MIDRVDWVAALEHGRKELARKHEREEATAK